MENAKPCANMDFRLRGNDGEGEDDGESDGVD